MEAKQVYSNNGNGLANLVHENIVKLGTFANSQIQPGPIDKQMDLHLKLLAFTDPAPYGFFPASRAYMLDQLATIYKEAGKYDKAMKYIHEAMFVIKTFKFEIGVCNIFINYGSLLSKKNELNWL